MPHEGQHHDFAAPAPHAERRNAAVVAECGDPETATLGESPLLIAKLHGLEIEPDGHARILGEWTKPNVPRPGAIVK